MIDASIARYPGAEVEAVSKGQTIFLHDALGNHMYVVLAGQVEIKIGEKIVDVINPGGIFGEMALVDSKPRAGTAIARTDGSLLKLNEKQFTDCVRNSPDFAIKVLRAVVERVRRADAVGGLTHSNLKK